jgi:hypothetical protein
LAAQRLTEADYAIRTWRYLRLAMVTVVVGLGASVAYEWVKAPGTCFQGSISAYWYTPVQAYFVGALITVGVCLVCLKGNSPVEDALLNLAGLLAPFVALVPTPHPGRCASAYVTSTDPTRSVTNNVTTLLIVEIGGLLLLALLAWRKRSEVSRTSLVGYGVAAAAVLALTAVFWADRDYFVGHAHYAAAVPMFACIVVVAVLNSLRHLSGSKFLTIVYAAVAAIMVGAVLVIAPIIRWGDWDHGVLVIEIILISSFVALWVIQTVELWNEGIDYGRSLVR